LLPLNISISRLEFLKICNVEHLWTDSHKTHTNKEKWKENRELLDSIKILSSKTNAHGQIS
jgi:hypothetical protein